MTIVESMDIELPITIQRQPDYTTCGPSLHAVYSYFGDGITHTVSVADPLMDNPLHGTKYYRASIYRLIGAIFLGAATADSNFLVIHPKKWRRT